MKVVATVRNVKNWESKQIQKTSNFQNFVNALDDVWSSSFFWNEIEHHCGKLVENDGDWEIIKIEIY